MDALATRREKRSLDQGVNNFGQALIDLTLSCRLLIASDRCGEGAETGKPPCEGLYGADYDVTPL